MSFLKWLVSSPDDYLAAFEQGFLRAHEVAEDVKALEPKNSYLRVRMEYEFVRILARSSQPNEALVWEVLGFDSSESPSRLSEYFTIDFPVVTKTGTGKMVQAIAFVSNVSYTNVYEASAGVKALERILNRNLVVLFSDYFVGNSFMLPLFLVVATEGKVSKLFPNVCFTGAFNDSYVAQPTDGVDVKHAVAQMTGRRLVTVEELGNIKGFVNFVQAKEKSVPVFVGTRVDSEAAHLELSKLYEKVKQVTDVSADPYLFERLVGRPVLLHEEGDIEPQRFGEFATAVTEFLKFRDVPPSLCSELVPHLAFKGPVALAFIVGLRLKPYVKMALYHYENNSYHLVLDLRNDPRKILYAPNSAETVLNSEILSCSASEMPFDENQVAVVLELSGRSIVEDVRKYLERIKLNIRILRIWPKTAGSIPVRDWSDEVSSIAKLLASTDLKGATYHFFFSCPVPIAFGLGLHLKEDVQKLCVYHYALGDYHLVYSNVR